MRLPETTAGLRAAVSALIAGDDPLIRAGLALLLRDRADVVVRTQPPTDVVARDLGPLGLLGPDPPLVPTLALVPDARSAAAAIDQGYRGALSRAATGDRLAAALVAVAYDLQVVDNGFTDAWIRPLSPDEPVASGPLTPREHEVLILLGEGLSNRRIARRLGVSEHTAKFHVAEVLARLGARNRTDAVVRAARQGLLSF